MKYKVGDRVWWLYGKYRVVAFKKWRFKGDWLIICDNDRELTVPPVQLKPIITLKAELA